jgi:hypothetical protein
MKKLFAVLKVAYAAILRPLVAEKIKNSPTQIDDTILRMLDGLFDYDGTGK